MILSYADCITKYGNAYQLNKALEDGLVFIGDFHLSGWPDDWL